jgi:hypothetical protein
VIEQRLKRGTIRDDGMVFWAYASHIKSGQHWVTADKFAEKREVQRKRANQRYSEEPAFREARINGTRKERLKPNFKARKAAYCKRRMEEDPLYALSSRLRGAIRKAISGGGYRKRSRTKDILGCSWEELKTHIENQFTEGMSWENRSEWHIDHIIPLASATTEEELIKLNHHTNLQPLWAKDNLSKGAKILWS